jgi:hypothetical protein
MFSKKELTIAAAAFMTTWDEEKQPVIESVFYLALGGQSEHIDLINTLINLRFIERRSGPTLVPGPRGIELLKVLRELQVQGVLPKDI